jgi:hypothetical protein
MKFGITGIFTTLFLTFLFYTSYQQSKLGVLDQVPNVPGFLVPVSTGKERSIGSGNRDASMYTQTVRRRATVDGFFASGRVMKETTHTTGFTTGVVEVYVLSDIRVRAAKKAAAVCAAILDGGDAMAEYCQVYDDDGGAGNLVIDGGNADANVCAV